MQTEQTSAWLDLVGSTRSRNIFLNPWSWCTQHQPLHTILGYNQLIPARHPWAFLEKKNKPLHEAGGGVLPSTACSSRWAWTPALLLLLMPAQPLLMPSTRKPSSQALQNSPPQPLSGFADLSLITPATKRATSGKLAESIPVFTAEPPEGL